MCIARRGYKPDLMRKDARCTLQFHAFRDFPDRPYKDHKHDCRSVTAKGTIEILDGPRPLRHSGIRMKCS